MPIPQDTEVVRGLGTEFVLCSGHGSLLLRGEGQEEIKKQLDWERTAGDYNASRRDGNTKKLAGNSLCN